MATFVLFAPKQNKINRSRCPKVPNLIKFYWWNLAWENTHSLTFGLRQRMGRYRTVSLLPNLVKIATLTITVVQGATVYTDQAEIWKGTYHRFIFTPLPSSTSSVPFPSLLSMPIIQGRRHKFESGGTICERSEQKNFFLYPPLFV